MAYRIVVDAGNGGYDNGVVYNGRLEKDDNLDLALAVGEILANNGVDVLFTRIGDTYLSPLERAHMANEEDVDFFLSIHRNSSQIPNTYSGVQTLIYDETGVENTIAENINEELENVGFTNLGVDVRSDLAVLRRTNMPSLFVEAGFINTDSDNQIFDEKFNDIAYAIATGIMDGIEEAEQQTKMPVYRVQVGLFSELVNAENFRNSLEAAGYDTYLINQGDYYAVQVGQLPSLEEAADLEQELRLQGYSTLIVRD